MTQHQPHPAPVSPQDAPRRVRLPNRRISVRDKMVFKTSSGDHLAEVSFGFDRAGVIREVFCIASKSGSDMQALVHDACVAISIALQSGARIGDLAASFGELRNVDEETGPPASVLGYLARMGADLELELIGGE